MTRRRQFHTIRHACLDRQAKKSQVNILIRNALGRANHCHPLMDLGERRGCNYVETCKICLLCGTEHDERSCSMAQRRLILKSKYIFQPLCSPSTLRIFERLTLPNHRVKEWGFEMEKKLEKDSLKRPLAATILEIGTEKKNIGHRAILKINGFNQNYSHWAGDLVEVCHDAKGISVCAFRG